MARLTLDHYDNGIWMFDGTTTLTMSNDCDAVATTKSVAPRDAGVDAAKPETTVDAGAPATKGRPDPEVSWSGGIGKWADYNGKKFDPSKYVARATALAGGMSSGAKLVSFSAGSVAESGVIDLTESASMRFDFRATQTPCEVVVIAKAQHLIIGPAGGKESCAAATPAPPRCTLAQIWARAKVDHKLTDLPAGTVATIGWNDYGDGAWSFSLPNEDLRRKFDLGMVRLDDRCN